MSEQSARSPVANLGTQRPLKAGHVVVVGSGNLDLVVSLQRVPRPGETVMGERMEEVAGGKGANQAIAAARRATCSFVGCVGNDDAGGLIQRSLAQAGVGTKHLLRSGTPTGKAFITVTPDGENSIVVLALANETVSVSHALDALEALRPTVVLAQLEIPFAVVEAASEWAERNGATFVLNPSPVAAMSPVLLGRCDPLILNAEEARAILRTTSRRCLEDLAAESVESLAALVARLTRSVVVTDGSRGACVGSSSTGILRVSAEMVAAADTTGAGDEFAGALAAALAFGRDLNSATELANAAAGRLVQVSRGERLSALAAEAGGMSDDRPDYVDAVTE